MKHIFSKLVVLYCIAMSTFITVYTVLTAQLTSGIITALVGLWGGELLLLCLKRILGGNTPTELISDTPINNDTEDTSI